MRQIQIKMTDMFTNETVMRSIDISNFTITMESHTDSFPSKAKQTQIIKDWITTRAEPQHDTFLDLVDFWIA